MKRLFIIFFAISLFSTNISSLGYRAFAETVKEEEKKEVKSQNIEDKNKLENKKKFSKNQKKKGKKQKTASNKSGKTKKSKKTTKNAYNIKLSAEDRKNLYRLVQSEVGYMDEKSKLYVASVVLNRVKDKQFPNTVTEVALQNRGGVYQFSPVRKGGRFWYCDVYDSTKEAVDKVLKNGDYSNGALYFVAKRYTTLKNSSWFDKNLKWLFHHNGQDYYR